MVGRNRVQGRLSSQPPAAEAEKLRATWIRTESLFWKLASRYCAAQWVFYCGAAAAVSAGAGSWRRHHEGSHALMTYGPPASVVERTRAQVDAAINWNFQHLTALANGQPSYGEGIRASLRY